MPTWLFLISIWSTLALAAGHPEGRHGRDPGEAVGGGVAGPAEGGTTTTEARNAELLKAYLDAGYDPESINPGAMQEADGAVSDEVVMADGDVIRGEIIEENEDEVVIRHPVFQELRIPRGRIVAIKRAQPRPSRPGFGELVTGAGVRPLSSTRRGVVAPVPEPEAADRPDPRQVDDQQAEEAGSAVEDDTHPIVDMDNWSFTMGAAFGYVQNVNDEVNVRLSAQAEHNSELARLRINNVYFLNRANGVVIDNDVEVSTIQDWFFSGSRFSIFAKGTYQWDEFEEWEQRISGYLGPGYKIVDLDDLKIDGRLGGGVTYEYGIPQLLPELLVSTEWNWQIDARQRVTGNFAYAPDVTESNQYRLSLNLEWNFRLQDTEGMSFYLGLRNEYQSIVPEGSTRNDLRMFGGIKYEF